MDYSNITESDECIRLLQCGRIPLSWLSESEFIYWLNSHGKALNYFLLHCPPEFWSLEAWKMLVERSTIKKEQIPQTIRQNLQIMTVICREKPAWIQIAENDIRIPLAITMLRENPLNWRHIPVDLKTVPDVYHVVGRLECGCRVHSPSCPACRTRNRTNNFQPSVDADVEFLRMATIID